MVERALLAAVMFVSVGVVIGCAPNEASPDAGGPGSGSIDAPRNTDFRDAPDCAPGGSGTGSGAGCGSGSGTGAPVDASVDAPCDIVMFVYEDAAAASVWVTGTFSSWAGMPPGARPLTQSGSTWSLMTPVGPGSQQYKFIIDGNRWVADPMNPNTVSDGFGGVNSVVVTCGGAP